MESFSATSLILILGLLAGGGSVDLVSTLPAKDYFKSRDIEVSAERLMELAAQTPDSGKKQIGQLMALSYLSGHPDLLKKSAKAAEHRKSLEDIAEGKAAADANGFAASYAQKVLRALSGQKAPPPAKRAWKDATRFLPENASLIGIVDLAAGQAGDRKLPDLGPIFELFPKVEKESFWTNIEKIGNVQLDSIGVGYSDKPNGKESELVVRFAGKGNAGWLISSFPEMLEARGNADNVLPNGDKYRVLLSKDDGPAVFVIGNSEVLVGGYPPELNPRGEKRRHESVLHRLIASRGKSDGPFGGALKGELAKVPVDASGAVVGLMPKESRNGFFPVPESVVAHAKRAAGGLDLQFAGAMTDDMDAKKLVTMIGKIRDDALQELNKLQGQPIPVVPPGLDVGSIIALLESIQVQGNGVDIQVRALVPDEVLTTLPSTILMPFAARRAPQPPPNPKKE